MKVKKVFFCSWLLLFFLKTSSYHIVRRFYEGCFWDTKHIGDLNGDNKNFKNSLTLNLCQNFCSNNRYKFFGARNK